MKDSESDLKWHERGNFPTTHWSAVLAARDVAEASARDALETLCRAYWYPLYAFARRRGYSPPDAEDLIQAFFAHLLSRDTLSHVAPDKGRFRSFLLASLKQFMVGQWRKDHALKRGGLQAAPPIDESDAESRYMREPVELADPAVLYERRWAFTLLERVLNRLEGEAIAAGKQALFTQLQPFLTGDRDTRTYAEISRDFGVSEGAIKMTVLRMRERLRTLFSEEVGHTVGSEAEAREEMRHLVGILGASPPRAGLAGQG